MEEKKLINILRKGTEFLESRGVESPRLNMELLICVALDINRLQVYTQWDKPMAEEELIILRDYTLRRARREPLQYITGKGSFFDLDLDVNPNVLIPRPETELLADIAVRTAKDENLKKILDIGTGSGCLAIYAALNIPESNVHAIDNSPQALATAKTNAEKNNAQVTFYEMDILKKIPDEKFDFIISNPPYIPENEYKDLEPELLKEPQGALLAYKEGLEFYHRMAEIMDRILNPGGCFIFEHGADQKKSIEMIFSYNRFELNTFKDIEGNDRIVKGKCRL
ncbi:MAG: peptide chain release factor N(5)-glutamine methyltransferase [Candidatus Kapaibacterium sp.]